MNNQLKKQRRNFRQIINQRQPIPNNLLATMGDGFGNLRVIGKKGYVYVTINGAKYEAFCSSSVAPKYGKEVWVGVSPDKNGRGKLYEVLSDNNNNATSEAKIQLGGYAPSSYYAWGGQDPLHVDIRAIDFLKVGVSRLGGMYVNLGAGKVWTGTAFASVAKQDIDLTTHRPSTADKAALVMISIDNTGAVIQTKGTEVDLTALAETDRPAVPADTVWVSGCVRVYEGQTQIREGQVNTDFDDLRFIWSPAGGSGASSLAELSDVNPSLSPTDRALLVFDADNDYWDAENNLLDTWDNGNSAGRLWGGILSDAGSGKVDITAGAGLIKDKGGQPSATLEDEPTAITDGQGGKTMLVTWDAQSDFALVGVGYNLIYWDASAAGFAVQLKENFYANFDFISDFTVGRVYYDGTNVTIRLCGMNRWNFARRVQMFGEEVFPVVRATGLVLSGTGTRNIAITDGRVWAELVNPFTVAGIDTSVSGSFTYWYRNGSGGWTSQATQTQINNTQYDDGDGTLGTLTANRYGVHWVYSVHDSTHHVVFGQGDYTLAQAELAQPPATLPGLLSAYATLIGKITIKKSASVFTSVQSAFTTSFVPTDVTEHNDLSGIQGGATDEYYHLTAAQVAAIGAASTEPLQRLQLLMT